MAELCEAYYTPVLGFLLREGRDPDSARELAQEFFARLLRWGGLGEVDPKRGKFRSYLLGALKHFLSDRRKAELREKRGGGREAESLDAMAEEEGATWEVADPASVPSDTRFDRDWALAIMARALDRLETEFGAAGKSRHFERLKPWLVGDAEPLSQAEAASDLGLSEGAVKVAIHRLRKQFREVVRAEVSQTLSEAQDVDEELRYLVEILGQS